MIIEGLKPEGSVIYTNEFLSVIEEKDKQYLFADWSGILDAKRAKTGCMAIVDCLKTHPNSKILNNNSKVTGHYPGAIDWVGNVWFPILHSYGARWFAWVYSPEFYTQLGTDQIISLSSQVKIQTFYETYSALQWLFEQR